MEVEEHFSYPGGKMGSIKCCRTILTDDDGNGEETEKGEKEVAMQTVIFYRSREEMEQGKSYYKKLEIQRGITVPLRQNRFVMIEKEVFRVAGQQGLSRGFYTVCRRKSDILCSI